MTSLVTTETTHKYAKHFLKLTEHMLLDIRTVSYTHLDVYKRQLLNILKDYSKT